MEMIDGEYFERLADNPKKNFEFQTPREERCQKFNERIPKMFVQAVLLLTCIHGTPGVNLGQDTDYPFQN
jgi:hypothetical protein